MWWVFKRDPVTRALYQEMRAAERKWRRFMRRKNEALHRGDAASAKQHLADLTRWLGIYNSAVMRMYPEDFE